jgi:predicted ATPase
MSYEAGTRLGPYEIHSPLDRGGMGEVYRARDVRLDRYVALKVLPSALTRDEHRRARFEREAKAVARLQHPHICAVYDVGVGDVPYLVLELLDGRTLAQHLSEGRPSLQAVMAWIDQIGKALEYAHQQGVIHRDLKPANVMITPTGAKLLDFGLARFEHESADGDVTIVSHPATSGGIVLGTPGYMSPEQAAGSAVGTRSDVFAFGVLAYELLTGVPAFRRTTPAESLAALFGGGLRLPSEVRSDLPSALDPVIERCCAQKADARYESVREAAAALAEGLAGATAEVAVRPAPEPVLAPAIPEPVTSLVGREREVEEIRHLLQNPAVRLITLTGPGGGGKTRLAVDVARRSGTIFPGGVFFVDLGSINDPARFDLAVAAELQVRLRPGESLTGAVATAFRENRRPRTLVVLDSFEQLVDTAPRLTQLLQAVPDLTCLVTSRIVLHLTGEREFPVLPLPVPDTSRRPEPGQLAKVPSVALFLERAQSANPAFALDTDNVMAVAQICVRLDGLPLALELAAARVRALTPQALLSRLERRLPVLTTGARDLPVRQQTLRNTIEWSYDLLTEAEQRLLRRLAVFTGGCTLEAVESVCDAGQDLGVDALNGVSSLADKSLVQLRPDPDGDTRVTMLETIREYGVERLAESEDVVSLHRAHAAYYLLLAEDGNAALSGEHHDLWLRRFTSDHDNFRGALDWMLAHAQLDWGLRLGIALFPFWQWKEHGLEARGRLRQLAAMRGEAATAEWAKLLMSLGILHSELAEYKDSADAFLESLAISRRLGDRSAEVVTLNNLGVSQRLHGSYDSAVRYLEE